MTDELQTTEELSATLERVLKELDESGRTLPESAIREAQQHRESITPRLIEAVREAASRTATGDVPDGNLHYFALYLLAEFRAHEALPAVIELVSGPPDAVDQMFGDVITEDLPKILAALAPVYLEVLDRLIDNQAADEYVRWSAASTYLLLVRDGVLSRESAAETLRGHLRRANELLDDEIAEALVMNLADLALPSALDEIREAFRLDLVDEPFISLASVEEEIARGDENFQVALERCRPTGIADTVEDIMWWSDDEDFEEDTPFRIAIDELSDWDEEDEFDTEARDDPLPWTPPETIRNSGARVGRNDPCPCGSGKKFKKCCGDR